MVDQKKPKQRFIIEFVDKSKEKTSSSPWDMIEKPSITREEKKVVEEELEQETLPIIKMDPTDSFEEIVQKFEKTKGFSLEPEQIEALRITYFDKENFIFAAPTGFGKSIVPEFMAFIGWKFIYVGPLKSLANEKIIDFSEITETMRDTGDDYKRRQTKGYWKDLKTSKVIVATYERLDSILRKKSREERILDKTAVVIDEIHMIGNKSRGHVIEGLILKLRYLLPEIRVIGLSATLPNAEEIGEWLKAKVLRVPDSRRPIPLKYEYTREIFRGSASQETDQKLQHLMNNIKSNQHLTHLVFCSSRMRCEQLARGHVGAKKGTGPVTLIKFPGNLKVSYHHAGLTIRQKSHIEKLFRDGEIQVLYTTTTFAMGVNLPADVCHFFDLSRWDAKKSERVLYEEDEVPQIAGRAGRRSSPSGLGLCRIYGHDVEQDFARKAIEDPKGAQSQLNRYLTEKILEWIVTDIATDKETIVGIALSSLATHQHLFNERKIMMANHFLFKNNFLEETAGFWSATKFGTMTIKLYMNPITVVQAKENILGLKESFSHLDIYNASFETEETLYSIIVREMDSDLIEKSRSYIGDSDYKMSDELLKMSGLLFSGKIREANPNIRLYISKGDQYSMKIQSERMIDCLAGILPLSPDLENIKGTVFGLMKDLSLLIKYQDFNTSKLDQYRIDSRKRRRNY
jgi:helicase